VRRELAPADVVLPSLSTVSPETFHALNRPHGRLLLEEIIAGMKNFRQEFAGKIWLEVMLVKGLNDSAEEMARLREVIAEIKPDKVHLNTVVRPPVETDAKPLAEAELRELQAALGANVEIIAERPEMPAPSVGHVVMHDLLQLVARHPATLSEISKSLNCKHEIISLALNALIESGVVEERAHQGKKFYKKTA
jgi:wyosine [tRNA(Phe)-imidazoG37] synthetase (radical SAM superfamily)